MLLHNVDPNVFIYGLLAGFLSVFINYCIGKPGGKEFSPNEIFSFYTVWLAKLRLKRMGVLHQYEGDQGEQSEMKKVIVEAAERYFTWEKAFGMCVVCNGFWVSLICGICYTLDPVSIFEIVLISHVTIRIIAKYL